jgi:Vitamin K-dependent gamma-carboxylase
MGQWKERLTGFFFPIQSDDWLTLLRIGLGVQVLLYLASLRSDWNYLFARTAGGLNGRALAEGLLSIESPLVPRLDWLVTLGSYAGLAESTVLFLTWWLLLSAAVGLLTGLFSRTAAITAWFLHLSAAKSGGLVSYGVDNFMTTGLFYLMVSPLPGRNSLDRLWRKMGPKDAQFIGFSRRVLQLHLSVIYFFSGLTKCMGSGWWDGSNIWRALIRPPFNIISPEILVRWKYTFPIAAISICLLETAYPVFIWHKKTRTVWLILVLGMHAAIALTMGLYLFALIMIVLNVAAFGPDLRWLRNEGIDLGPKEVSS